MKSFIVTSIVIVALLAGNVFLAIQNKDLAVSAAILKSEKEAAARERDALAAEVERLKKGTERPTIKENEIGIESVRHGNISVFTVRKPANTTEPQFRKLSSFVAVAKNFSIGTGQTILSIVPVGECVMIDGEEAYSKALVTHTWN